MVDFVGGDPESQTGECPAVWGAPGGAFIRGKTVTDPELIGDFNVDIGKGEDETDVWVPERLFPALREVVDGTYTEGRQGPGKPSLKYLFEGCTRSAIRLELRDAYDPNAGGFAEWRATGDTSAFDWGDWLDIVGDATARGVQIRRVRIVSEPVSEFIKWEHACTDENVKAGEDIRWLPRHQAVDLLLPSADLWIFDYRLVRWNFQSGEGANMPETATFSSDPRLIRDIAGSFAMAWERAIPHADYRPS
ncbi:DUF6879 family protein [Spirillospora sp. NPDC048911]|uniref:DUF6879 family protein n=1 Tax=Spirillospora sp. NPDC048911 TaxID=3364527 RepID=UPI00371F441C